MGLGVLAADAVRSIAVGLPRFKQLLAVHLVGWYERYIYPLRLRNTAYNILCMTPPGVRYCIAAEAVD